MNPPIRTYDLEVILVETFFAQTHIAQQLQWNQKKQNPPITEWTWPKLRLIADMPGLTGSERFLEVRTRLVVFLGAKSDPTMIVVIGGLHPMRKMGETCSSMDGNANVLLFVIL